MTQKMHYGKDYKKLPVYSTKSGQGVEVRPDVYAFTDQIANVIFVGEPNQPDFVLIDTGMPKRAEVIIQAAKERFGQQAKAKAILLTHGHFDHVGGVIELIEEWNTPVYGHPVEFPYLTGDKSYPKPDMTVEGGLVAKLSPVFPTDPIDISAHLQPLPAYGTVPELPDFEWIHVPGHTIGQVALFRKADGLLFSADAFVTTKQENLYQVATQQVEISGPPRYLTPDWKKAEESVRTLYDLKPQTVVAGHGQPVSGEVLQKGLTKLVEHWNEIAVPNQGRYVDKKNDK